jgi:hypothetical protein
MPSIGPIPGWQEYGGTGSPIGKPLQMTGPDGNQLVLFDTSFPQRHPARSSSDPRSWLGDGARRHCCRVGGSGSVPTR